MYQFIWEKFIQKDWDNKTYDPDTFHQIVLKILPKKGNLLDPRGDCITWYLFKILSLVIAHRLSNAFIEFGNEIQCGSVKQECCANANFALNISLQTLWDCDISPYVIFVDLVKAYDTVNQELLWIILGKDSIPNNLIIILQKLCNNTTINFSIKNNESIIKSTCGVKKGDNLAQILFLSSWMRLQKRLIKIDTFDFDKNISNMTSTTTTCFNYLLYLVIKYCSSLQHRRWNYLLASLICVPKFSNVLAERNWRFPFLT